VDDKTLLKLPEAGLGIDAASRHLNLTQALVSLRVKEYVETGILVCADERERVDWRAFGKWMRNRRAPQPV